MHISSFFDELRDLKQEAREPGIELSESSLYRADRVCGVQIRLSTLKDDRGYPERILRACIGRFRPTLGRQTFTNN